MSRLQRKKTRTHSVAACSKAASNRHKDVKQADALSAKAVAATFGDDAATSVNEVADAELPDTQRCSRGQRKRLKRRTAFMRKMGIVSRVAQTQRKPAATAEDGVFAGLNDLQSSLVHEERQKTMKSRKTKPLSGRQRQKLAVRELGQLKAVQTHASFQRDPIAAIQAHLQHTIVQANDALLQKTQTRNNVNKMIIES